MIQGKQRVATILAGLLIVCAAFGAGFVFGTDGSSTESRTLNYLTNGDQNGSDDKANLSTTTDAPFFDSTELYIGGSRADAPVDMALFWDVWDAINAKYVTSDMPSDEDKLYGAISGLVGSLDDPYSVFLTPVESKMFEEDVSGNFQGVGMEVGIRKDLLTIIAPLKDTPAERAGLMAGDVIAEIDGVSTWDLSLNEAVSMIRGEKGTEVVLTIIREGGTGPLTIPVIRDEITIPVIDSELRDDGVFVIRLFSFTATSPDLFRQALREYIDSGSAHLIVDLRNNPGGYLNAAVDIASWFLPAGEVVARESYGESREETVYRSKGYNVFPADAKLVILQNGGSASASEILAGALREHGVGIIVGTMSFGKGSVQELLKLESGTSLKLTIARWLTPEGVSISEEGLTPDFEIDITADDIEAGEDPQMDAAIKELLDS